jgi:hypothetical protein
VDEFKSAARRHFLSHHAAVAISMVALEAKQTSHLFGSRLNPADHIRLGHVSAKMGGEDPLEILKTALAGGDAARLRITKTLEMQVLDVAERK